MFSISRKNVIITGAGRGIGRSIAIALSQEGCNLILVSKNLENLKSVREDIQEDIREKVIIYSLDLSCSESIKGFIDFVNKKNIKIDILINAAGIISREKAEMSSPELWSDVIQTNLLGTYYMCRYIGAQMLRNKSGKIINIASILGILAGINVSSYSASKSAIIQLTKSLASEWAKYNINVNCIAPGYIYTDMTKSLSDDKKRYETIVNRIPAGRWGETEDLIGSVIFLSSDASRYVHGHTLIVDGGWIIN